MDTSSNRPKRDYSIYLKSGFITVLILLLCIPTAFIQDLIREREGYSDQVKREITHSWGKQQTVTGPLLMIPYQKGHLNSKQETYYTDHNYFLTPTQLEIECSADTEVRKKSIYEAILYNSTMRAKGAFDLDLLKSDEVHLIKWEDAKIVVGLSDPASITKSVNLSWNDHVLNVDPGSPDREVLRSGIMAKINIDPVEAAVFDLSMSFRGSEGIHFVPTAKSTNVKLSSNWPDPGFVGQILADNRDIADNGFSAEWQISEFNRLVPDVWSNREYQLSNTNNFGVEFINPVNHYQKNMRSAKYAMLITSLTFTAFFFFEMIYRQKVHPVQYGLIGVALVLFYYLLLSITEHLGFKIAYSIAATATVGLIVSYSSSLLKNRKYTFILLGILTLLYSYIFVLLQLEEFALIAGSVGLFCILAGIMYVSRNVDWYRTSKQI